MRISRLELYGFKSFPNRTAFEFGPGISCIVGPNGSGKSNVVDALRWCIGEQSARSLRGADMQDVIFAGSADRPPVGFAEVLLTLSAEEGSPFPGVYASQAEVMVGRRLHRSGTAEYSINRVRCRRRDILELFLDTGVGRNLYSFVEQGRVDRIIHASPDERRSLIDEAAGISRYKLRRDEAAAKLTATALQLDRAADVADEQHRRLKELERHVWRAGRFRRLRARIRQNELLLGLVRYSEQVADRRALQRNLREEGARATATRRAVLRREADLVERREELEVAQAAASGLRDEVAELDARLRELEAARVLHERRAGELDAQVERSRELAAQGHAEAEDADRREQGLAQRAEELTAKAEELGRMRERAEQERGRLAAALAEVEAELRERQEHARAAELSLAAVQARLAAEQERQAALPAELERLAGQQVEASLRVASLERELEAGERAVQTSAAEAERARGAEQRAREAARAAAARVERASAAAAAQEEAAASDVRDAERAEAQARAARAGEVEAAEGARAKAEAVLDAERDRLRRVEEEEASAERARVDAAARGASERAAAWVAAVRVQSERALAAAAGRADAEEQALEDRLEAELLQAQEADAGRAAAIAREQELVARIDALRTRLEVGGPVGLAHVLSAHPGARTLSEVLSGVEAERRAAIAELLDLPVLSSERAVQAVADELPEGAAARLVWLRGDPAEQLIEGIELAPSLSAALARHAVTGGPVATSDGSGTVDARGVVRLGPPPDARAHEWLEELRQARSALPRVEAAARAPTRTPEVVRSCAAARAELRERSRARLAEARARGAADVERIRGEAAAAAEAARAAAVSEAADRGRSRAAGATARLDELQRALEAARTQAREVAERGYRVLEELQRAAAGRREELGAAVASARAARDRAVQERGAAVAVVQERAGAVGAAARAVQRAELAAEATRAGLARARAALADLERQRVELTEVGHVDSGPLSADVERTRAELGQRAAAVEHVEAAADEARARARAAVEAVSEGVAQAAAVAQEQAGLAARREELARASESARERARRSEEEVEGALQAAQGARGEEARARADGVAAAARRGERWDAWQRARATCSELQSSWREGSDDLTRLQAAREEAQGRVAALEEQLGAVKTDIEVLRSRLSDRYQVSLAGLLDRLAVSGRLELPVHPDVAAPLDVGGRHLDGVPPGEIATADLTDRARVERAVAELEGDRTALAKLGEVHVAALDEYRALAARHEDLVRQRGDLEESVGSIRAAIAKMNRTCRARFRETFDRVDEVFRSTYPRLVDGGSAHLALTDQEDLLEAGVEIYARPPGKRLQSLTLLSGGEKAMTALALLISLFQVRPSPFCVLDEVDAPLDEANGARFNELLRDMAQVSQFLVITHNRKTMECADTLYGVTMARPGVSSLVSVTL